MISDSCTPTGPIIATALGRLEYAPRNAEANRGWIGEKLGQQTPSGDGGERTYGHAARTLDGPAHAV